MGLVAIWYFDLYILQYMCAQTWNSFGNVKMAQLLFLWKWLCSACTVCVGFHINVHCKESLLSASPKCSHKLPFCLLSLSCFFCFFIIPFCIWIFKCIYEDCWINFELNEIWIEFWWDFGKITLQNIIEK